MRFNDYQLNGQALANGFIGLVDDKNTAASVLLNFKSCQRAMIGHPAPAARASVIFPRCNRASSNFFRRI